MQKKNALSVYFILYIQDMNNCLNQGGVYWKDMPCYEESMKKVSASTETWECTTTLKHI